LLSIVKLNLSFKIGRSVREAVAEGLAALIREHHDAIAGFGDDTRESALHRAAERIRLTRHKVESYSCYLAEEKDRLEKELAAASATLRAKVERLAEGSSHAEASEPSR
jgi:hypothetical protein